MPARSASLIAVLVALTTVAMAQELPRKGTLSRWHRCLGSAINALDDEHSDARTIGAAAVAQCWSVRLETLTEQTRAAGITAAPQEITRAMSEVKGDDVDYATAAVLAARKLRQGRK